jgi:hypothetical protein
MFREITIEHSLVEAVRRVNLGELLGWLHGFEIPMLEDICLADSMAPEFKSVLLGWLHGFAIPMLEDIRLADSMAPGFESVVTRSPFRRNWI